MTELRNAIIRKEIPENEYPDKMIGIVEKILDFNASKNASEITSSTCTSKGRK